MRTRGHSSIIPEYMKARFFFTKKGDMRFISHLDLIRLFQRALRRAHVSVLISKGFNPHLKIVIEKALKLGLESDREVLFIHVPDNTDCRDMLDRLNNELPKEIQCFLT